MRHFVTLWKENFNFFRIKFLANSIKDKENEREENKG